VLLGNEIAKAIVHLDWMDIFQDEDMSPFENALEAHSSAASIAALKLGTNLSLKLGKGFLSGQKAYEKSTQLIENSCKKLEKLYPASPSAKHIRDLFPPCNDPQNTL